MTTNAAPTSTSSFSSSTGTIVDRFADSMRRGTLRRSDNRIFGGVCSGLAHQFGVSPKAVRIGAVVAAIFGPVATLYLIGWLIVPDSQGRVRLQRAFRDGETSSIVLAVITGLVLVSDLGLHVRFGPLMVLVALAAYLFYRSGRRQRGPQQPTTTPPAPAPAYPQDAPRW